MLRCSRHVKAVIISGLLGAGVPLLLATDSHAASEPLSTTTTSIGYELSDDFLTLYPEYDDHDYQYLVPENTALPATGPAMRVGLGALALVVFGVAFAVLARGPRRRARADGKALP